MSRVSSANGAADKNCKLLFGYCQQKTVLSQNKTANI